jgi:putative ABC transport system ATP-binding protein
MPGRVVVFVGLVMIGTGAQQRVAIARALVNNPVLVLADELTGNLDSRTSIEVMGIFQRLNVERNLTVLLVTHEHDIAEYGTRIIGFRDGRVVGDHPVEYRRWAPQELALLPPDAEALTSGTQVVLAESSR